MSTNIVRGSVLDISERTGSALAETLAVVDAVLVVDTSGSMAARDARDNQKRYDVACQELARLQGELPGQLAVIGFSNKAELVPGGVPPFYGGNTDLAGALRLAKTLDHKDVRTIVISDGMPDDPAAALAVAAGFRGDLDVVYVGPGGGRGRRFLGQLAQNHGGRYLEANRTDDLLEKTRNLLTSGVRV